MEILAGLVASGDVAGDKPVRRADGQIHALAVRGLTGSGRERLTPPTPPQSAGLSITNSGGGTVVVGDGNNVVALERITAEEVAAVGLLIDRLAHALVLDRSAVGESAAADLESVLAALTALTSHDRPVAGPVRALMRSVSMLVHGAGGSALWHGVLTAAATLS